MQDKATPTPGPWIVRKFNHHGLWVMDTLPDRDGKVVANVIVSPNTNPAWSANAKLICAAPDLLAACRRMVEALSIHHMSGKEPFPGDQCYADAHDGLYAAIEKAARSESTDS